jgi:hypothetical protein
LTISRAKRIPKNHNFARDEYEPEVTTILPRLPQATCAAEVERIIREEFAYWFYDGINNHTLVTPIREP